MNILYFVWKKLLAGTEMCTDKIRLSAVFVDLRCGCILNHIVLFISPSLSLFLCLSRSFSQFLTLARRSFESQGHKGKTKCVGEKVCFVNKCICASMYYRGAYIASATNSSSLSILSSTIILPLRTLYTFYLQEKSPCMQKTDYIHRGVRRELYSRVLVHRGPQFVRTKMICQLCMVQSFRIHMYKCT